MAPSTPQNNMNDIKKHIERTRSTQNQSFAASSNSSEASRAKVRGRDMFSLVAWSNMRSRPSSSPHQCRHRPALITYAVCLPVIWGEGSDPDDGTSAAHSISSFNSTTNRFDHLAVSKSNIPTPVPNPPNGTTRPKRTSSDFEEFASPISKRPKTQSSSIGSSPTCSHTAGPCVRRRVQSQPIDQNTSASNGQGSGACFSGNNEVIISANCIVEYNQSN